jgi:hypothetical protein
VVLVITGFVACGISGCSGGGFGPSFAPRQAQVALLVAGLVLLPFSWLALHRLRRARRAAASAGVSAAGAVLAMIMTGIGPSGCPWSQTQAVSGPDAFAPGTRTCSSDDDARP